MRDLKILRQFWTDRQSEALILCTIVEKTGSGYRNLGAKKMLAKDGASCGYLSGGCLEGEIVRHALNNWENLPIKSSFSTMNEEDRLFGYQTGCAGLIGILFERLPGIDRIDEILPYGDRADIAGIEISLKPENLGRRRILKENPAADADFYFDRWQNPVHLFIIGCGPNAQPFAELAPALGWKVTFLDYRQAYTIEAGPDIESHIIGVNAIGGCIPEKPNVAVVLATHNYEADMQIVSQLNGKQFGYLGLVGPKKRFEKMKEDLPKFYNMTLDEGWAAGIKTPAGLRQGWTPEDIAFSIVAEIQFGIGMCDE